jgi:hypothetical protein
MGTIREFAWALDDVRRNRVKPPVTVVAFGPHGEAFETARILFEPFQAEVIPEPGMDDWTKVTAEELAASLK